MRTITVVNRVQQQHEHHTGNLLHPVSKVFQRRNKTCFCTRIQLAFFIFDPNVQDEFCRTVSSWYHIHERSLETVGNVLSGFSWNVMYRIITNVVFFYVTCFNHKNNIIISLCFCVTRTTWPTWSRLRRSGISAPLSGFILTGRFWWFWATQPLTDLKTQHRSTAPPSPTHRSTCRPPLIHTHTHNRPKPV